MAQYTRSQKWSGIQSNTWPFGSLRRWRPAPSKELVYTWPTGLMETPDQELDPGWLQFKHNQEKWLQSMTYAESNAIEFWVVLVQSADINRVLTYGLGPRRLDAWKMHELKSIHTHTGIALNRLIFQSRILESVLHRAPHIPHTVYLFRGLKVKWQYADAMAKASMSGQIVQTSIFQAFSPSPKLATEKFSGDSLVWILRVPAGSRFPTILPDQEILFPPGTHFRIDSAIRPGTKVLDATVSDDDDDAVDEDDDDYDEQEREEIAAHNMKQRNPHIVLPAVIRMTLVNMPEFSVIPNHRQERRRRPQLRFETETDSILKPHMNTLRTISHDQFPTLQRSRLAASKSYRSVSA